MMLIMIYILERQKAKGGAEPEMRKGGGELGRW